MAILLILAHNLSGHRMSSFDEVVRLKEDSATFDALLGHQVDDVIPSLVIVRRRLVGVLHYRLQVGSSNVFPAWATPHDMLKGGIIVPAMFALPGWHEPCFTEPVWGT